MIAVKYIQAQRLLGRVVYVMNSDMEDTRCHKCKHEWYGANLVCTEVCMDCQRQAVFDSFTTPKDIENFYDMLHNQLLVYKPTLKERGD